MPIHARTVHALDLPVRDQLANFTVCFQVGLLYGTNQRLHQIQLVYLHCNRAQPAALCATCTSLHTVTREIDGSNEYTQHNCHSVKLLKYDIDCTQQSIAMITCNSGLGMNTTGVDRWIIVHVVGMRQARVWMCMAGFHAGELEPTWDTFSQHKGVC